MVLIHHLYQYSGIGSETTIGLIFQCMGYLAVGMFFFYTGYGLMSSSRKDRYLDKFILHRVVPLYGFYVCLIIIYTIYKMALGIDINPINLMKSFLFGGSVVPLAWYLQTTFLIYLVYWLVFTSIKNDSLRLVTMCVILTLYCMICYMFGLSSTWFESVFCLMIGMLWAYKKEIIDEALKCRGASIFIIAFILFVVSFLLQLKLGITSKMLSAVMFATMVTTFTYLVANTKIVDNKTTQFLGRYSLEIYASQGFFLLLKRQTDVLDNTYVFIAVTLIGTIIVAILLKPIYEKILDWCRKI